MLRCTCQADNEENSIETINPVPLLSLPFLKALLVSVYHSSRSELVLASEQRPFRDTHVQISCASYPSGRQARG